MLLTPEDTVGESYYNPFLPVVVDELTEKGLLVENDGALCVFPPGFENRKGEPLPLIVRKSDGGYGYPATDLAAVRDRTGRLEATKLVYVVGAEQALHLRLVFAVAAMAGYLRDVGEAEHVGFGMVLGTDGKKLASRSGDSERLIDLLSEGVERAAAAMKDRDSELLGRGAGRGGPRARRGCREVRRPLDRAHARLRLRLGPHARLRGQHRALPPVRARPHPLHLPARRGGAARNRAPRCCSTSPRSARSPSSSCASARRCEATADASSPSKLCTYLFDLASSFTTFYEACRVLVDDEATRTSRLALCDVTARVLECGLSLLGMEAPVQM